MKKSRLTQLLFVGLTALLLVFPLLQSSTVAKGADLTSLSQAKIISVQVPPEVLKVAQQNFPKHMHAIIQNPSDYGYTAEETGRFTLGNPFNIYQYDDQAVSNTGIYYFPVLSGNEIKAMLAVSKAGDGTFSSTFSPSFAKKLQSVLLTTSEPIRLFTTKGEVRAVTSKEDVVIGDAGDGTEPLSLNKADLNKINELAGTNVKAQKYSEVTSNVESSNVVNSVITPDGVGGGPIESHYLNVPYFYQGSTEYCWACTMASMLNYNRSMSLTMQDVVAKVPHELDGSATGDQVLAGYKLYGVANPFYSSDLTFQNVAGCIDIGKPCHSFWQLTTDMKKGHSMVFRGYELYSDGSRNVCLMDPHQGYITIVGHDGAIQYTHYTYSSREYMWTAALYI